MLSFGRHERGGLFERARPGAAKKPASNESFWLVGQPDVELRRVGRNRCMAVKIVDDRGIESLRILDLE